MFYCDPCGQARGWPTDELTLAMSGSYGACEICRKRSECYDIPSKHLPQSRPSDEAWNALAGFCAHGVGMLDQCDTCCPPAEVKQ